MRNFAYVRAGLMLASLVFAAALPASAAPAKATPLAGLHFLVGGTWKCTYRAGAVTFPYTAAYAFVRDGHWLQETASWTGGGDEELLTYDAKRGGFTVVVLDDQASVTVMPGKGRDPNHFAYRSAYPDTSIAVAFDRISDAEYTLHGSVRSGTATTTSVDTCVRAARD